jgi:hypothetical protein
MSGEESSANPFTLLADETRLGIIEAIGDASGDGEYATLSYSTIREALDGVDPGKLNYHLRQLRGRFVGRTDDGYRLLLPGIRVYQAVVSGSFDRTEVVVDPQEYGMECPDCDAELVYAYRNGRYIVECPACDVVHSRTALSAAAFDPQDPETLRRAGEARSFISARTLDAGICPYCDSAVKSELTTDAPEFEDADYVAVSRQWCSQCGWYGHANVENVAAVHPATRTFLLENGLIDDLNQNIVEGVDGESKVLSEDPWRVEVRFVTEGETIRHVLDETLDSVGWERLNGQQWMEEDD